MTWSNCTCYPGKLCPYHKRMAFQYQQKVKKLNADKQSAITLAERILKGEE